MEADERATIGSDVCSVEIRSQSCSVLCLRICVDKVDVIDSESCAIILFSVEYWSLFILAETGESAIRDLDADLVLCVVVCEICSANQGNLALASDEELLNVCSSTNLDRPGLAVVWQSSDCRCYIAVLAGSGIFGNDKSARSR